MKKHVIILLAIVSLLALTACGGQAESQSQTHTHAPSADWSADTENHWRTCECGETVESGAHTLEDEICTVCGSEVYTYDDGAVSLTVYNAYGDFAFSVSYDAEGNLMSEERAEYTYSEDGTVLRCKTYLDGAPFAESQYDFTDDGERYEAKTRFFYDDGAWDEAAYNADGNCLSSHSYDAEGNAVYAYLYEYAPDGSWMQETYYDGERKAEQWEYRLDEDGGQYTTRYLYFGEDDTVTVYEYDEMGNETLQAVYGPDGEPQLTLRYENVYNSDGERVLCRTYENDRLAEEVEYVFGTDEDGSWWSMSGKTTNYHEDGTKTVHESDVEATWSTETHYAADGSVVEEIRYEYLRDENGEDIGTKGFRNGKLFQTVEVVKDENGETASILMTDYHEDGTRTVREYDDVFTLLQEVLLGTDGSVIG